MIAHIATLVRWEWFKTRRRWMPWILLVIPLLIVQMTFWGTYYSYRAPINIPMAMSGAAITVDGSGQPTTVSFDLNCNDVLAGRVPADLPPNYVVDFELQCDEAREGEREKRREMLDRIILPGSLTNAVGLIHGFGVVLVAIMTVSLLGTEFGWGTLRMVLAKGTGRWQLLSAKLMLIALLVGAALAIIAATTAASSMIASSLVSERPEAPPDWAEAAATFGRAWFGLLPYAALAGVVTVLASSTVAGIAAAVGYLFTEWTVAALLLSKFDWAQNVADYMLGRNITAWILGVEGGESDVVIGTSTPIGEFPDALHAFLVLAVYIIALGGLAFWRFQRNDIRGPSGA